MLHSPTIWFPARRVRKCSRLQRVYGIRREKIITTKRFELSLFRNYHCSGTPLLSQHNMDAERLNYRIELPCHDPTKWKNIEIFLSGNYTTIYEFTKAFNELHNGVIPTTYFNNLTKDTNFDSKVFLEETLPFMQKLGLEMPNLFPSPITPLIQNREGKITITRLQAACLVAHAVFCTLPQTPRTFPTVHFAYQLGCEVSPKMTCILHYFNRISKVTPKGDIIVHRKVLSNHLDVEWWKSQKAPITEVSVRPGKIEDDEQAVFHADFANKYLGGGSLFRGCVQEEILFMIKPELIAPMLFCEHMLDHEALIITGAERYANYIGYGRTFDFGGDYQDKTEVSSKLNALRRHVVAIDAIIDLVGNLQFETEMILRDINKAYVALRDWWSIDDPTATSTPTKREIYATGHWGCGAFGGDKELKAIQQIIAASVAGVGINYYAFGHNDFATKMEGFLEVLKKHNVTVGDLVKHLLSCAPSKTLFDDIIGKITDNSKSGEQKLASY